MLDFVSVMLSGGGGSRRLAEERLFNAGRRLSDQTLFEPLTRRSAFFELQMQSLDRDLLGRRLL